MKKQELLDLLGITAKPQTRQEQPPAVAVEEPVYGRIRYADLLQAEDVAQIHRDRIQQEIQERGLKPALVKRAVAPEGVNAADQTEAAERAMVAQLNRDALSAVQAATQLRLQPYHYAKWRPTVVTTGSITGLPQSVECHATDGLLGWFTFASDTGPKVGFYGHVDWFTWMDGETWVTGCPPTLHSMPTKPKEKRRETSTAKPKKATKQQKLLELLGL